MPVSCAVDYVNGDEAKKNWVYFRPGSRKEWIILFPGDISDFHTPGTPFGDDYGLDTLMWIACARFPDNPVLLIKAHIMEQFFAIYVNFLLVDSFGNPRISPTSAAEPSDDDSPIVQPDAPRHLLKLLHSVRGNFRTEIEASQREADAAARASGAAAHAPGTADMLRWDKDIPPLIIAGFSKGYVVLNAFLRRPSSESEKQSFSTLWRSVRQVHFLDAGANGGAAGIFPSSFLIGSFVEELKAIPSGDGARGDAEMPGAETGSNSGDAAMEPAPESGDCAGGAAGGGHAGPGCRAQSVWSSSWQAPAAANLLGQGAENGVLPAGLFLHGTPRQLQDESTSVREEWDNCVAACQEAKLQLGFHEYFTDLDFDVFDPDRRADALAVHFKILESFRIPGIASQTVERWKLSS